MTANDSPPILDYATPPGGRTVSKIRRQAAVVFWSIGVGIFLFVPAAGFFWLVAFQQVALTWATWMIAIIAASCIAAGAATRPLLHKVSKWEVLAAGMSLFVLEPFIWGVAVVELLDLFSTSILRILSLFLFPPALAVLFCWLALAFRGRAELEFEEANPDRDVVDEREDT